jgi:hypothetical protein
VHGAVSFGSRCAHGAVCIEQRVWNYCMKEFAWNVYVEQCAWVLGMHGAVCANAWSECALNGVCIEQWRGSEGSLERVHGAVCIEH